MNRPGKLTKRVFVFILSLIIIFSTLFLHTNEAEATENVSSVAKSPVILTETYEVTNGKIVPGEDFTLSVKIKNYSSSGAAEDVVVDISYPDGVSPVYGTTAQQYIKKINAGDTVDLTFDFNTYTSISTETLDFYVYVVFGGTSHSTLLTIPCGSDSPFSILSANVPSTAELGQNIETSLTFKVLGSDNISNVSVELSMNANVLASSSIGIVTPGVTKTQNTSFSINEYGEYIIEMRLKYTDASGQNRSILIGSKNVSVLEGANVDDPETKDEASVDAGGLKTNNMMLMGVSGILIILISFIIIYIVIRKKR